VVSTGVEGWVSDSPSAQGAFGAVLVPTIETVQIGVIREPKRDHGLWDRENYVSLQAANGHPSVGHAAGPPGVGVAGRAIVLRP